MDTKVRDSHFSFIEKDTREKDEIITSDIKFFGALYFLSVKKEGDKRSKKVTYSAATNILKGYRRIN